VNYRFKVFCLCRAA